MAPRRASSGVSLTTADDGPSFPRVLQPAGRFTERVADWNCGSARCAYAPEQAPENYRRQTMPTAAKTTSEDHARSGAGAGTNERPLLPDVGNPHPEHIFPLNRDRLAVHLDRNRLAG